MLRKLLLNLQLFGEGGDGGEGSSAVSTGEGAVDTSGEDKILASIPEKAKKYYQKATEKTKSAATPTDKAVQSTDEPKTTTENDLSYADLIKSDKYKEEHKAYMDKTIGDRLKKYKGLEETLEKHKGLLEVVAGKYGVSLDDENYFETLKEKIDADDSYYEDYAMKHDISTEEARRIVTMERKVARYDAEQESKQKQEAMRQQIAILRQNAVKTKSQFPQFDLDAEMQNEQFRKLCAVNNGDTTAAYMACHWNEILPATVQVASQRIQNQTAQAVAANKARPVENGISSTAPSVVEQNFKNMSLKEIRQYADEQRRKAGRK